MESSGQLNPYIVLTLGTTGMLVLTISIITFVYLYQRKLIKRKIAYQEIEALLQQEELKAAYALLEGQEMERQRIAEELHDNLGSILITLSMYAHTFQRASSSGGQEDLIERIVDLTARANDETRKLSHKLDTGALRHFGLKAALHHLVDAINKSGSIEVEAFIELNGEIANEVSLNIYRIVQELVNNTMKHAKASKINIDITQINKEYISFIYEDNGIGFAVEEKTHNGMGMRNINARAEKLNAIVTFGRKTKTGFTAVFEIPIT